MDFYQKGVLWANWCSRVLGENTEAFYRTMALDIPCTLSKVLNKYVYTYQPIFSYQSLRSLWARALNKENELVLELAKPSKRRTQMNEVAWKDLLISVVPAKTSSWEIFSKDFCIIFPCPSFFVFFFWIYLFVNEVACVCRGLVWWGTQ